MRSTKAKYTCVGGPLHGHALYLSDSGGTLTFTLAGQCVRYVCRLSGHTVHWVPA
jgi:hypothetical protein